MLVILLILFTNVLCDSEEDKYVDLLPDAEKQQFIEKVARRILQDVESSENKGQKSGDLSDEELRKHNDYVKSILKQESENIRRKGEETKVRQEEKDGKEGKEASVEALGVKPLESEKIADDPDLEQVDLTLRNDRREINPLDNSTEFIKVEVISDEPPIIKRSVRNESYSESESEETTTTASELLELVTEESEISTVHTETDDATNQLTDATIRRDSKENINPNPGIENLAAENKAISKADSAETDGADIEAKKSRRSGDSEPNENTNGTDANDETADLGLKSPEESNSTASTGAEEISTEPPETTTDNTSTTQDVDSATVISTATVFDLPDDKQNNNDSAIEELSENTVTSTLSDEGTTESEIDTTTSKIDTETLTTDYYIPTRTEYLTDSPSTGVATTEGMKIIEEIKNVTITTEDTTKPDKMTSETDKLEETTQTPKHENAIKKSKIPIKKATSKELASTLKPKTTVRTKVINNISSNFQQLDNGDDNANKNFIELEKVYTNQTKKKGVKEYEVYEIPADKSPFVPAGESATDQPYYIPVYNYAPDNAYFNPQNRLGPNAYDDEKVSAFAIEESVNNVVVKENIKEMSVTNNVDMEYSDTAFDNQRKKFGNTQKLFHSIHKKPANSSPEQAQGKVHLEDYVDSDYYFGRIRKDTDKNDRNNLEQSTSSNENAYPFLGTPEMNLKDHVRAVRNILFQQKYFNRATTERNFDSFEGTPKNKQARITERFESHLFRSGEADRREKNDNNIAIDYYFGRMKPKMMQFKINKEKTEPRFQQVGYIKNDNDTKGVFMLDQVFKDNIINYVNELMSKSNTNLKTGLNPATPLPIIISDKIPVVLKPTTDSKFRNQEKIRNAELNQIAKTPDVGSINTVLNMDNEHDLFTNLKKMQQVKMAVKNVHSDVKVNTYLTVLKDMVDADNMALKQYDWLGTTVDIQASFQKLFELVSAAINGDRIHPADLEILKYVIFLHKLATEIVEANDLGKQLRYSYLALPKNKREKKKIIKQKGLVNRVWLYLRRKVPEIDEAEEVKSFNVFLMDMEDDLYNLHDAIKNVAKITKYKNQHWYQNLKELYLSNDDKHLLELLLHMCVSRLFGLVEESAKNGMEDDYIAYMKSNKPEAKKTLEELLFVMQIMDEINKNVE
ncbi:unnamed protein product [Chrysodeixis includens]|uniref:Uncharacterized protein n=1 Tax=Chrysodeixis includens TaxID=689277 RepID=A0A9N8KWR9_CHRIL|nr:unnamed protein product [Chrysodeixis includens]